MKPHVLKQLEDCTKTLKSAEDLIRDALRTLSASRLPSQLAGYSPRVSTAMLLQQLSKDRWALHSKGWKRALVDYALTLAALQRAERLLKTLSKTWQDFQKELSSEGHVNRCLMEYPERLLMEVESNLLIRYEQVNIATMMIRPPGGQNSVMQMNMGEGKSSVTVPIVAAATADKSKFVRVIVGKAQSKQMSHVLVKKLGGLLDRRVWFLPISRSRRFTRCHVEQLQRMLESCRREGDILLMRTEHTLSFRLMAVESKLPGDEGLSKMMLETQDYMDKYSRDIVDESDANFDVNFELVYTIGKQQVVDWNGDRWALIQSDLGRLWSLCEREHSANPRGFEVLRNSPDVIPMIRILDSTTAACMMEKLAGSICDYGNEGLSFHHRPLAFRKSLKRYLLEPASALDPAVAKEVESCVDDSSCDTRVLWLLRGLIAGGLLNFALCNKRWRVNYGGTRGRKPPANLAVPY